MTITSEQFKQAQDRQTIARLQVVNSVNRKNKNGGQFWIVTIESQTKV